MQRITASPGGGLVAGLVIAAVIMLVWIISVGVDGLGLLSFLIRLLHVAGAIVWVGFIVFINFVQLVALQGADEQGRACLAKWVIPQVAWWFRHASTVTVLSGAVLLVMTGYLLPTLVYGSGVYVPPSRAVLLWLGVLGALVMLMFVHMYIWPCTQVVLGLRAGDADAKARARARVAFLARLNLILAVPVTLTMVAAAHLY
ncbi:MAG: hypothetical protein F9K29_23475 [Hyphomicrobiaceae bacterium]|nr:MAG: hypothetical protein F9K29_23475 [Hyphomicrobiaceae bacterium]